LQSNNSHVKRLATTREINVKIVLVNSIKIWIRVLKEIKKKALELLQDDIRLFFYILNCLFCRIDRGDMCFKTVRQVRKLE